MRRGRRKRGTCPDDIRYTRIEESMKSLMAGDAKSTEWMKKVNELGKKTEPNQVMKRVTTRKKSHCAHTYCRTSQAPTGRKQKVNKDGMPAERPYSLKEKYKLK